MINLPKVDALRTLLLLYNTMSHFQPPQQLAPYQVGDLITYYSLAHGCEKQAILRGIRDLSNPARRFYDVIYNEQHVYTRPVHYSWVERLDDGRIVADAPLIA